MSNKTKVADKSIRNVPLDLWFKFVGKCKTNNKTVTQGITEAINLYLKETK